MKGFGTNEENDERGYMFKPQEDIENGADLYGIITIMTQHVNLDNLKSIFVAVLTWRGRV
jgi:hypothetical protein